MAGLIQLLIILVAIGLIVWAVNRFIPMNENFRQLINVVAIVGAVLYVVVVLLGYGGVSLR